MRNGGTLLLRSKIGKQWSRCHFNLMKVVQKRISSNIGMQKAESIGSGLQWRVRR